MIFFRILGYFQRRIHKAMWLRELEQRFPTRAEYLAEIESKTHASAQILCDAARHGFQEGREHGYAQGYHDGRAEELNRAQQVFKEQFDREMCETRIRRFTQ